MWTIQPGELMAISVICNTIGFVAGWLVGSAKRRHKPTAREMFRPMVVAAVSDDPNGHALFAAEVNTYSTGYLMTPQGALEAVRCNLDYYASSRYYDADTTQKVREFYQLEGAAGVPQHGGEQR